MQRTMRTEVQEYYTPAKKVRSQSISSDIPSISGHSLLSSPPSVNPEPAYIASSAACQFVSADLHGDSIKVAQPALVLLNSFLDHILFNILSSARSTRLSKLRQAVPEILKPRLAREAIAGADEELREYLGCDEDEELTEMEESREPVGDFDLELAWKLARLRCMVYTRLGDMEEEDEDEHIERECLDERGGGPKRFSSPSSNVTPAAAIFLTSILEYLGEQALYYSGQHAQRRIFMSRSPRQGQTANHANTTERPVLEAADMVQIGRDSPLQRLWRTWRRPLKPPADTIHRPISQESATQPGDPRHGPSHERGTISSARDSQPHDGQTLPKAVEGRQLREPVQIPLPISEHDVDEIEVPGYRPIVNGAWQNQATASRQDESRKGRPLSMTIPSPPALSMINQAEAQPDQHDAELVRPIAPRRRSHSLPVPPQTSYIPQQDQREDTGEDGLAHMPGRFQSDEVVTQYLVDPANVHRSSAPETIPGSPHVVERTIAGPMNATLAQAGPLDHTEVANADLPSRKVGPGAEAGESTFVVSQIEPRGKEVSKSQSAVTAASTDDVTDLGHPRLPMEGRPQKLVAPPQVKTERAGTDEPNLQSMDDNSPTSRAHPQQDVVSDRAAPRAYHTSYPQASRDSSEAPTNHRLVTVAKSPNSSRGPSQPAVREGASPIDRAVHDNEARVIGVATSANLGFGQAVTSAGPMKVSTSNPRQSAASTSSRYSQQTDPSSTSGKIVGFVHDQDGLPELSTVSGPHIGQHRTRPFRAQQLQDSCEIQIRSNAQRAEARPGPASSQLSPRKAPSEVVSSSEDASINHIRPRPDSKDKKRSLEILIKGDETLHYTLTPERAREVEMSEPQPQSRTRDGVDVPNTSTPPNTSHKGHASKASVASSTNINGLRSHPPEATSRPHTRDTSVPSTSSQSPHSQALGSKINLASPRAREPKVEPNLSRDLADYARSTGPENEQQLPKALVSRPGTSGTSATVRQSAEKLSRTRKGSSPVVVSFSSSATAKPTAAASSSSVSKRDWRPEPRDARVPSNTQNSDLIDFIREGPPRMPGDHRINRTIAPFRRTMDSDDVNGMASNRDQDHVGRDSGTSTHGSSAVSKSVGSSSNSNTGLLVTSQRANGRHLNGGQTTMSGVRSSTVPAAERLGPRRQQRRVRDPYAIDDSDPELDEDLIIQKANPQEESLIDFLRNTSPPKTPTTQPIMAATAKPSSASHPPVVKARATATGFKRLMRSASFDRMNGWSTSTKVMKPQSEYLATYARDRNNGHSNPTLLRPDSPHLSQTGSKLDSYKPTSLTRASHRDRNRAKPEARDATTGSADTGTGDLARYLRSTGPVASPPAAAPPPPMGFARGHDGEGLKVMKDEGGFRAFFARRRSAKK